MGYASQITTFIRYHPERDGGSVEHYEDSNSYKQSWEVPLTDVFDRDEISDYDLLESWDDEAKSKYGDDGFEHYLEHGFFWNDRMDREFQSEYEDDYRMEDNEEGKKKSFWYKYIKKYG